MRKFTRLRKDVGACSVSGRTRYVQVGLALTGTTSTGPDDYEHYPIRLYEQEQEDMNMFHQLFRHPDVALADKLYSPDWVRVRRFFHTVKGFHTVRAPLELHV